MQSKRKIRIQLEDNDGDKYNLSLEGSLSKEKMLKVLSLLDSLDSSTSTDMSSSWNNLNNNNVDKLGDKLWNIIEKEIKNSNFTSTDILKAYNQTYKETTQLSIVSTYLTRFFTKNRLSRTKHGKEWIYTIVTQQIIQKPSLLSDPYPLVPKNNGFIQNYEKTSTVYDLHQ